MVLPDEISKHTDVRQSSFFARFMEDIGWKTKILFGQKIYLRPIPVLGTFAKMPRVKNPENIGKILENLDKEKIFQIKISSLLETGEPKVLQTKKVLFSHNFQIDKSPFNPTTTILIDLTQPVDVLFDKFTSAKRRAVRRAVKNEVIIKQSTDLDSFIEIRKKQYAPFGFLVTGEMTSLWKNFHPENAALLLAYAKTEKRESYPVGGILLLFFDHVAYYWYASCLLAGKKLFAPTLLVWEALKFAKKRNCTLFDFEGIFDERFPKAASSWKGFTKFKEGFGGEKIIYMENFSRLKL